MPNEGRLLNRPPPGSKINWGHSNATGLVFASTFNEGSGIPFDQVTGNRGGATGVIQWRKSGLYFSSASGIYVDFGSHQTWPGYGAAEETSQCSFVFGATVESQSTSTGPIVCHGYSVDISTSTRYFFRLDYDTTDLTASMTGFSLNEPGQAAVTYRGDATAANVRRYRDGHVQAPVASSAPSGSFLGGQWLRIGQFQGTIHYCYIYNRVLPAEQIFRIHSDPYAMFRKNKAGGSGITVTLTPLLSWFDLTDDLTPVYLEDSLVDSLEIEDGLVVAGGELDD